MIFFKGRCYYIYDDKYHQLQSSLEVRHASIIKYPGISPPTAKTIMADVKKYSKLDYHIRRGLVLFNTTYKAKSIPPITKKCSRFEE